MTNFNPYQPLPAMLHEDMMTSREQEIEDNIARGRAELRGGSNHAIRAAFRRMRDRLRRRPI